MRMRTITATIAVMMLLLAACGQKPGVHISIANGSSRGDAVGGDNGGTDGDGDGVIDPGTGGSNDGGSGGGSGGSGGGSGGSGGSNGSGSGSGGDGGVVGSDRTGITADTITIAVHAPTSGAAPIEPKAFQNGADTYWKWLESQGKRIHGRKVRIFFRDDKYKPSSAVDACTALTTGKDAAFLLIGAAGTDQIRACADYSNRNGIPYFSAGVQESVVKNYKTYFALTATYAQQMPPLMQYIKQLGANEDRYGPGGTSVKDGKIKIAFVRPNTSNFDDAQAGFERAFASLDQSKYQKTIKTVIKEGTQQEAAQLAQTLKNEGVDIVSPITAPNFTVYLAGAAGGQQYNPRYVGVGVTNGLNQGIARECTNQDFHGAMFFSPWPAWSARNSSTGDPNFERAVAQDDASAVNGRNNGGDLLMALWGINRTIHGILEAAGPNLTRQSLIALMRSYKGGTQGFFPDLSYSSGNPFGAQGVHALVGKCDANGSSGEFIEDPKFPGLRKSF